MSNATTKPNLTTVNTALKDRMKNAMRWESLLNALLCNFLWLDYRQNKKPVIIYNLYTITALILRGNMNVPSSNQSKIDNATKALALGFKLSTTLGVIIVLYYCFNLNHYPKGLTIGDGVFFVALSVVFGFTYLFFSLSLVAVGTLLSRPLRFFIKIVNFASNIFKHISGKQKKYHNFDFPSLTLEMAGVSIFGIFLVLSKFNDLQSAVRICATVFIVTITYKTLTRNFTLLAKLKVSKFTTIREYNLKKEILRKNITLAIIFLITPLFLGGLGDNVINASMGITKIKSHNVAIHVKAPYTTYLSEYSIKGVESSFGKDYLKYDNANILFDYVGVNTILSLPINGTTRKIVSIPSKELFIIR
ncbi:hypothetical protein M2H39_20825 [Vibrio vulnificus]|nr:hypothetical protein [Vibrio vulnificus]MCU8111646.1 hypothetical protein [Vibrio vulnificus]